MTQDRHFSAFSLSPPPDFPAHGCLYESQGWPCSSSEPVRLLRQGKTENDADDYKLISTHTSISSILDPCQSVPSTTTITIATTVVISVAIPSQTTTHSVASETVSPYSLSPTSSVLDPTSSTLASSSRSLTLSAQALQTSSFEMASSFTSTTTSTSTVSLTSTVTVPHPASSFTTSTSSSELPSNTQSSLPAVVAPSSTAATTLSSSSTFVTSLVPTASKTALPLGAQLPSQPSEEIGAGPVSSKRATAVGGTIGALAGLAVIVVLVLVLFKRRRKRESQDLNRTHIGQVSSFTSPRTGEQWGDKDTPRLPQIPISEAPIIDDNLIRMSLDHWIRPYAHDDPFRDSDRPPDLRITNPDPPKPPTPQVPCDHPGRFLARQRSALAAALFPFKRSTSHQSLPQPTPPVQSSPLIEDGLSEDLRVPPAALLARPSRPTMSARSSSILRQRPPDDVFLAPPVLRQRPSISPSQLGTSRSGSNASSAITTFQFDSPRTASFGASSTNSRWEKRHTGTSDPFEIDPRGGVWPAHQGRTTPEEESPNWAVHAYDGT